MGWTEDSDEDDYEITEEEMREFQLSKQVRGYANI